MLTGQLGRLPFATEATSASSSAARGGFASGQRFWSASNNRQGTQQQWPTRPAHGKLSLHAATVLAESETRNFNPSNKRPNQPELQVRFSLKRRIIYSCESCGSFWICCVSNLVISFPAALSRFPRSKWNASCCSIPSRGPCSTCKPPCSRHHQAHQCRQPWIR